MSDRRATDWAADCLAREERLGPQLRRPSFVRYARRALGHVLSLVETVMTGEISVQGTANLPSGPVLFVANHFTRSETFILPYIIDRYARRSALSLAHYALFRGVFGDFLRAVGALSTRHPDIKGRMVEDLLSGHADWLIYPEGSMIKNKQVWKAGRFHLEAPDRVGAPHTGAAVIALQAVCYRLLWEMALERGDHVMQERLRRRFRLHGAPAKSLSIVPINVTYYPIRSGPNVIWRLARVLVKQLPRVVEEELALEGNVLFKDTDITIYFGRPLDLGRYEALLRDALARVRAGGEEAAVDAILHALKTRVTDSLMRAIYQRLTVNIDHLVCGALRATHRREIADDELAAIVYLSARALQAKGRRRIHRSLGTNLLAALAGAPDAGTQSALALAAGHGVLHRREGRWRIDRAVLEASVPFHDIRLKNPVAVIANELEPVRDAVQLLREHANLARGPLRQRLAQVLLGEDALDYETDRRAALAAHDAGAAPEPKPVAIGAPVLLRRAGAEVGVVLCHGYLAAPAEVRPLADRLHAVGMSVYLPRLKGHGTVPGQLAGVTWQDWLASFDRGLALMRASCRHIVVAGFSMGALVAALAAARNPPGVIGLIAINPAVRLADRLSGAVPAVMAWNRCADALHLPGPRLRSVANEAEWPDVNYDRNELNGIRELQRLARRCSAVLPQVRMPALVVQADHDPVVSPRGSHDFARQLGGEETTWAPMAFRRHGILRGEGSEAVLDRVEEWLRTLIHRRAYHLPPAPRIEHARHAETA